MEARNEPKVSVVIPVYNGAKYLGECLESVLCQTWNNFEVIVVDDGSTDSSESIYRQFANVLVIQQENQGQSAARNAGARKALGECIAFIDQDDRWYPEKLERQVEALEEHPGFGLVHCDADRIDDAGNIVTRDWIKTMSSQPKRSVIDCIMADMMIPPGTVLMRKALFDELGGFDVRLSGYEDDDLFLRAFRRTRMHFQDEALMQWRIYPTSYSYTERMDRSREIYIRKLVEAFPNRPESREYYVRDLIVPRFLGLYLFLYTESLMLPERHSRREHYRQQLRWIESFRERRSLVVRVLSRLPIPIAAGLQKMLRVMPRPFQRLWIWLARRI